MTIDPIYGTKTLGSIVQGMLEEQTLLLIFSLEFKNVYGQAILSQKI